jgi:hypothetical protein
VQTPPAQYCAPVHWASVVQPPEHTFPAQAPDVHVWFCAGGQPAPLPGQFAARVADAGVPPQLAARQLWLLEA